MFIEVCLIAASMGIGSDLYNRLVKKENKAPVKQPTGTLQRRKPVWKVQKIPSSEIETSEFSPRELNQFITFTGLSTVFAVAGALFYFPLSIISAIMMLIGCIPFFKTALHAIFKERRIRIEILDSLGIIIMIAAGYFVAASLACVAGLVIMKLRMRTEKKAKESLVNVFEKKPEHIWIVREGIEIEIPFDTLCEGDIIVASAGEVLAADGIITEGMASLDQHMLTGESQPAEKSVGDTVFAATIVISGKIYIKAEKTGKETSAAKIGAVLNNTSEFTAYLEAEGRKVADASVLPTAFLVACASPFVGISGAAALLCANCLVNIRILTPIGMLNFLKYASENGLLIKDGRSLEVSNTIDTVVFDKTGTLTMEQPYVRRIYTFGKYDENFLLRLATAAEQKQNHPIAKAICAEAKKRGIDPPAIEESAYKIGYGVTVEVDKKIIRAGSERFMESEQIKIPADFFHISQKSYEEGCSLVCISENENMVGAIEMEPTLRPESEIVINALKKRGMTVYILSGDHEQPTKSMAEKLGVDNYFAGVLPEEKASIIETLQENGASVCFVGDGINDSIALKKAEISVSLTGASAIATDSAQIILMDQTLKKLPVIFETAEGFQKNMKDTFFASSYPTIFGIGGVFFANFQVIHMLFLFMVSAFWGGAVSMTSGIDRKKKKDH
ncbi:MAG: heavy metal translocating P-type ATPase [Candidatus Electrothrix sp. AW3_4]|nr:heavy metal translocating P-type ATPase [Candidatus Electrothrix gigas]